MVLIPVPFFTKRYSMSYDPEAIQKQIDQHQTVINTLKKQKVGLDESIAKLQKEINKLEQVMGLLDSVEK